MNASSFLPGFEDAVHESQRVFRSMLHAVSHPGRPVQLPRCPLGPWPLEPGTTAVALTLFDLETPVWLQDEEGVIGDYLRFHCGCPVTDDPGQARFAVITDPLDMPPLAAFDPGDPDYPDRSATLILQVRGYDDPRRVALTGPGIETRASLALSGVREGFWHEVIENHGRYPCGIDLLLVSAHELVGLPRSVRVELS